MCKFIPFCISLFVYRSINDNDSHKKHKSFEGSEELHYSIHGSCFNSPDYYSISFNFSLPPTFQVLSNQIVDKIYRPSDFGTNIIDANNCKENSQISAYKWLNTPLDHMGVLKVNHYNGGWVVQKFHVLSTAYVTFEYQRMWVDNERWTDWKKIEYK